MTLPPFWGESPLAIKSGGIASLAQTRHSPVGAIFGFNTMLGKLAGARHTIGCTLRETRTMGAAPTHAQTPETAQPERPYIK